MRSHETTEGASLPLLQALHPSLRSSLPVRVSNLIIATIRARLLIYCCDFRWVNNCIGLYNYPYFIRFLFYVDLACSMHLYLVSTCAFSPEYLSKEVSNFDIVVLVANYVLCIPVLIAVGLFSLYHFWNMAVNVRHSVSNESCIWAEYHYRRRQSRVPKRTASSRWSEGARLRM